MTRAGGRALLVLRPGPGASATAAAAETLGFAAIVAPLFVVRAVDWSPPATPFQAVLMTSANAARLGGAALDALTGMPLYAVGESTAAAARDAGFTRIVAGAGGIDAIVAQAARDGVSRLLHLAGRDHRPPDDARVAIERRTVYASDAVTSLPEVARAALPHATALLHSPRAAALFATLVEPGEILIATISAATRDAAGPGWRAVAVADRPTDTSLLAAAAKLCDHDK
jgi:uroporphyrinogen-III synthase